MVREETVMSSIYKSLLSATSNTRDLGGYPTRSGCMTRRNKIWRSDAPTAWNASDLRLLKEHGMTSIIDLRTSQEAEKHPCAYASEKGIAYQAFPITAGSVPPSTLAGVPLSYMEIVSQKEVSDVLRTVLEAEEGVLICCTAGKDRTGVISAVLLLSCGVEREAVIQDYTVSREYNRLRLERYLADHPEVDREIVLANETSMSQFMDMFFAQYETVENYYLKTGLTLSHLARIRGKLLESGPNSQQTFGK